MGPHKERAEAVLLSEPGQPTKAAVRLGGVLVIVALRLGPGAWEPLYAMSGLQCVSLPLRFSWTLEAIGALEAAAIAR
jgi:hypothetical protein